MIKKLWVVVIVFLLTSCNRSHNYYVEGVNVENTSKCERFEKYIKKHWEKNKDGFFDLKNYDKVIGQIFEPAGIWQEKYPNEPIQFGCTRWQSKEYIEFLFGKPNRITYYERFKIDVWVYCMDWSCLTDKSYVGGPNGKGLVFEFDENNKAITLLPWYVSR